VVTPVQTVHQAPDVIAMVVDSKLARDYCGDTRGGPHVGVVTVRDGTFPELATPPDTTSDLVERQARLQQPQRSPAPQQSIARASHGRRALDKLDSPVLASTGRATIQPCWVEDGSRRRYRKSRRDAVGGGSGGKAAGQREHSSIRHATDTEWGTRIPGVGGCTESGTRGGRLKVAGV
jgi:hypothetical protein